MPSKRLLVVVYGLMAAVIGSAALSHVVIAAIDSRAEARRMGVLATPVVHLRAISLPFDQAIAQLSQTTGVPIALDRAGLETDGHHVNTPISQVLFDVSLQQALDALISAADIVDFTGSLYYRVDPKTGGMTLATLRNGPPADYVELRVYDVRDIVPPSERPFLNAVPDWFAPNNNTFSTGGGLFGNTWGGATFKDGMEALTNLIQDNVSKDSWWATGGNVGSIRDYDGRLFIRQGHEAHEKIALLLENMCKDTP
ncbi:hypothetical protein BH10PLA1_BH10PLA1_03650 [soil metagenome]